MCFLTGSSLILSEKLSLSTILKYFKISKIDLLDSLSLMVHDFFQIKLKKHEHLSVPVRFRYI